MARGPIHSTTGTVVQTYAIDICLQTHPTSHAMPLLISGHVPESRPAYSPDGPRCSRCSGSSTTSRTGRCRAKPLTSSLTRRGIVHLLPAGPSASHWAYFSAQIPYPGDALTWVAQCLLCGVRFLEVGVVRCRGWEIIPSFRMSMAWIESSAQDSSST